MLIIVGPNEQTLPILIAAKQLVMNGTVPDAEVQLPLTSTSRISVTLTEVSGTVRETWRYEKVDPLKLSRLEDMKAPS